MSIQLENTSERLIGVHSAADCVGSVCCIHKPHRPQHAVLAQHFRQDRGIMERICPHGIGHPDPDDMAWREDGDVQSIHGCDGCCR